ncbi:prolyl-tRNA synthetase [Nitzschia inconspicua]|uniref:Prolyl-tRNA synthetase n=1 Tax=Nitzschia inconspicua TaxID=303405 RepID=A0A9K3PXF3_9STRA|nr:prolyl-tRNA synthetase [Nitzschia inconspicua]KAG7362936.1 prolyl-tRNA synthetase [Nitzschia inconspicua]
MRRTISASAVGASIPTSSHNSLLFRLIGGLLMASMFLSRQLACAFSGATYRVSSRLALQQFSKTQAAARDPTIWKQKHSIRLFSATTELSEQQKSKLESQIKAKGDEIRKLKENGADKSEVGPLVEELLALKAQLDPSILESKTKKQQQSPKSGSGGGGNKQQQKEQQQSSNNDDDSESDFITARSVDYSKWYNDIIRVTGLAETSPVRGCMVIKPWGMSLWDKVRTELDEKIKEHGAENAYFPLLIPKSFLSKEAEHVDGFAKECAVVTHHRLTAGEGGLIADPEAELEDPLIIRPTSETMIWYMFRKWINSHRDLPLKVNQWANVMRWEMRTRPFLRTSEFLWQEGHTAHATAEGALEDAKGMMEKYAALCRDLLAIPVVRGVKSPSERFAGAEETFTIEALMQNGWALQSGTSHFLGQSFGKAFDVTFQDADGEQKDVWGTSWGVSTRLLGALIMTHSDDNGLVLPPRVAPIQVVIVPIPPKKNDEEGKASMEKALDQLEADLKAQGLKVKVDDRDFVRNGAKYFEWERKGVPLRIELGPRDVKNNSCIFKYRAGPASAEKISVHLKEAGATAFQGLDDMQQSLLAQAESRLESGITQDVTYDEMKTALENDEASSYPGSGLYLVPWKCDAKNEDTIKTECKATIRCYPLEANEKGLHKGKKCFYSGEDATHMALFGRAF